MSRKKKINQLIENNNSNALFAFFDKLDATRRGAYFVLDYLVCCLLDASCWLG